MFEEFAMIRSIRRTSATALALAIALLTSTAAAQSPAVLKQFEELHARLVKPDAVLSSSDAFKAADRLAEWRLAEGDITPETRAKLHQLQLMIALGKADAKTALDQARQLLELAPDDARNLRLGFIAASAAGDAQFALDRLKQIGRKVSAAERRELADARRQLRFVGEAAPDADIRTEDDTAYSTSRRGGKVLVIDFWNMLRPPAADHLAALKALHGEYKHDRYAEFVGVNADSETRTADAKQFVEQHEIPWKTRYEFAAIKAPITHEAFHAGSPPWCVIIDSLGYIRAIGAANEPRFQYALHAAIAEASGKHPLLAPRDRTGKQPTLAGDSEPEVAADASPKKQPSAGDLPSNPEAQAKFRQARTFLKAKNRRRAKELFQEIVREYPGTREAKEAQEYLDSM